MALTKCKECGATVSTKAEACPNCGAKRKPAMSTLRKVVYALIGLFLFSVIFQCTSALNKGASTASSQPQTSTGTASAALGPAAPVAVRTPTPGEQWEYSRGGEDKIRGGYSRHAIVQSINTIDLNFPYNKESNHGYIGLQDVPGQGKDIYFKVDKGQFDCSLYNCPITLKFDNGPIKKVSARRAAAGASDVVFLPYAATFAQLRAGKHLTIEATFYGSGDRQIEFDVSGLAWP